MKPRAGSLNKIDKPLTGLIKEKRTQIKSEMNKK